MRNHAPAVTVSRFGTLAGPSREPVPVRAATLGAAASCAGVTLDRHVVAALNGDRSGLKVRLAGTPFKFAFDGYISHRPTLKMEGTLAADAASLRDTLRWAEQPRPPGGGFGRFALKAQTNVAGGSLALSLR